MTCENGFLGVLCVCVWEGRLQVSHSSYLPVAGERDSAGWVCVRLYVCLRARSEADLCCLKAVWAVSNHNLSEM